MLERIITITDKILQSKFKAERQREQNILTLMSITGLSYKDAKKRLMDSKINENSLIKFYTATGRFPKKEEEKFINEFGIDNWYNAFQYLY